MKPSNSSDRPLIIEDFAGPGGWDEGARLLGLHGIIGYEKDTAACATGQAAGHVRVLADVQQLHRPDQPAWGYIASPPCQPWSRAGSRKGLLDQPAILAHVDAVEAAGRWIRYPRDGWHDDKSPLVLEPVRAILELRPMWIAMEQVPDVLPFWERLAGHLPRLVRIGGCGVTPRSSDEIRADLNWLSGDGTFSPRQVDECVRRLAADAGELLIRSEAAEAERDRLRAENFDLRKFGPRARAEAERDRLLQVVAAVRELADDYRVSSGMLPDHDIEGRTLSAVDDQLRAALAGVDTPTPTEEQP